MPLLGRPTFSMYYEDTGPREAPTVVLMHSFLCDTTMWGPIPEALAERYRVLNVDLRGHGRSTAPSADYALEDQADDVLALLDRLAIDRAALVGLSQGGMTALRLALARPERVRALVLLDTSADPETPLNRAKYLAMAASVLVVGLTDVVARQVEPLMFSDNFLEHHRDAVEREVARWRAMDRRGVWRATRAVALRTDISARLREIAAPTLVAVGEHDRALPVPRSRRLAEGIYGAMLATIPRAGHLSVVEQPEDGTRLVRGFLTQHM